MLGMSRYERRKGDFADWGRAWGERILVPATGQRVITINDINLPVDQKGRRTGGFR